MSDRPTPEQKLAQELWERDQSGNVYDTNLTWAKARGDHAEYLADAKALLDDLLPAERARSQGLEEAAGEAARGAPHIPNDVEVEDG